MYLKNLGRQREKESGGIMAIFTNPWIVIAIVVLCFAILTPKIFIPLFRQIFGLGKPTNNVETNNDINNVPPQLRMRHSRIPPRSPPDSLETDRDYTRPGSGPQFGRSGPGPGHIYSSQQTGSSSKSILTYLLPVYAVGIGLYMVYTLFKVFNKSDEKDKKENEDSDYEDNRSATYKFRERNNLDSNFVWDANEGEFKLRSGLHFPRSEESEDEANNYERYKDLDPDYVEFIKEKRRAQRAEKMRQSTLASKTILPLNKDGEIPLTSNTGLTSITNTNVLMNDTLERMKYQLNKINTQLTDIEKRGNPLDDPELESLRLQLSQTELQMAKIMSIVNTVSTTVKGKKGEISRSFSEDIDDEFDEEEYDRDMAEYQDENEEQNMDEENDEDYDDEIMINRADLLRAQETEQNQHLHTNESTSARRRRKKKNKNKSNDNSNQSDKINNNNEEDRDKKNFSSSLSSSTTSLNKISNNSNKTTVSKQKTQQVQHQNNTTNQNQSKNKKKNKSKKKNK